MLATPKIRSTGSIRHAAIPSTMQSIVLRADDELRRPPRPGAMGKYRNIRITIETHPTPTPGSGEALLQIQWAGVCGSDIHAVARDEDDYAASSVPAANWQRPQGLRLGHEYTGKVVAVGPQVSERWVGRLVTGNSLIPCRQCPICRDGQPNHCPKAELIGFERDGIFGEYAVVPATSLHRLDSVRAALGKSALEVGTMAEPLGVAANALHAGLRCSPYGKAPSLLVYGGGPLGLMAGLVAQCLGFGPIVIAEPNPMRLNLAASLGLIGILPPDVNDSFCRTQFGCGATMVLDACGKVSGRDLLTALRPGGVIVSLARTGAESSWPDDLLITNGICRVCTRGHVGFLPWVLRQIASGSLDPSPLITKRLDGLAPLGEWLHHPDRFADHGKVLCRISSA